EPELEPGSRRPRMEAHPVQPARPSLVAHRRPAPEQADDLERLLQAGDALTPSDRERAALDRRIDAEPARRKQAPAADRVDRRELLREQDRIARGQHEDIRAELQ